MDCTMTALNQAHVAGSARPCSIERGFAWLGSAGSATGLGYTDTKPNFVTKRTTRRFGRLLT
jgi:hypothetical protein